MIPYLYKFSRNKTDGLSHLGFKSVTRRKIKDPFCNLLGWFYIHIGFSLSRAHSKISMFIVVCIKSVSKYLIRNNNSGEISNSLPLISELSSLCLT